MSDDTKTESASPDLDEAQRVCAEAYQVVGSLLSDLGLFGTERATKILDNLSQHRRVHEDVLPWPKVETQVYLKALEWSEEREPCEECRYTHVVAKTNLGNFTIEWKGWKLQDPKAFYLDGNYFGVADDLEEAKGMVSEYILSTVSSLLEKTHVIKSN